jgi:tetratricopeptide (TPR) repeat protein
MENQRRLWGALISAAVLLTLLPATPARACLWDYDTLLMERSEMPDALELITGKFRRHSKEFYEWRVRDRLARLGKSPRDLALLDDLGVAYDKLDEHQKALDTMQRKEAIEPGLYTTAANLGTFYIHSGQLEKGLEQIRRAISINPSAHFGREVAQQHLVEYLIYKRRFLERVPTGRDPKEKEHLDDFSEFVFRRTEVYANKAMVVGVLGMMRFGKHDHPILLEALANMLPESNHRLKARGFLKASYESSDEPEKERLRLRAETAIRLQLNRGTGTNVTLEDVEREFLYELAEADEWWNRLREDELRWIAEGGDIDAKFAEKYYEDPEISTSLIDRLDPRAKLGIFFYPVIVIFGLVTMVAIVFRFRRSGRRPGA